MSLFKSAATEDTPAALSVTQFTRRVKELLETGIRPCWIRGEISNLRQQSSGHLYFSLKDAGAQLSAVLFRGDAIRQSVKLRDGLQVLVYGEISVYEARGNYQLIVRVVVEDGVGRLQREFEALKRKLADEGLFDAARKLAIPPLPRTVAFITSPTGAAVQDFIRIMLRRGWRGRLVVLPAKVQGEGAAAEMVEMLRHAEALAIFDLIVIGRGGGSLEDLWAFNEEILVRAVAALRIPTISAVGHEIDFTLTDFAASLRAETPSAAAEMISSNFVAQLERLTRAEAALERMIELELEAKSERFEHASSRLRLLSPAAYIERGNLRVDDLANRLGNALQQSTQRRRDRLQCLANRFVQKSPAFRIELESHRLLALWKRLQSVSPQSVLNRGFAMVRDASGKPIQRRAEIQSKQRLTLEFGDGQIRVTPEE
ncbi:MAG TPA: exodeoxyribonuclease VII large subunit [Opitutaceae bacterium]|nr:exodeoxyribonuclease VII large subunit [Opitutaceae bacterium]